jgi:hypothetical protein
VFAATTIEAWWKHVGSQRYPDARELFITADAGGSNGYRARVWKAELQRLADKLGISIRVSHFPPGTSKWNKVEHRLFSFISINWRGRPLRTHEIVVNLIANTTNRGGLVVRAQLDRRKYPRQEDLGQGIPRYQHREGQVPWRMELRHPTAREGRVTSRLIHSRALSEGDLGAALTIGALHSL